MTRALLTVSISLLLVIGLTAGLAQAQATSQPAAKAHQGHDGPFASLNLTADQKTQIKAILEQAHKDAKAVTDKADKAKIRKAAFDKIKTTVLTPDQVKQLEARRQGMHPLLGKLGEKLGLTADQKTQIKAILEQAHKDAQAATDKADKAKIMKAAFEKVKTTVLTPDQVKKLAEIMAERKAHHKGSTSQPAATT